MKPLTKMFAGKDKWLIVLIWLAVFVPHLEVLEVNIMEARNFITAREMLQDGQWILTRMNGAPRYEKPPLPTWITAAFGGIFGLENVFFLRLAAAFFMLILLMNLYKLILHLGLNERQSLLSVIIFATGFSAILTGRDATWDVYTHAFMVCGLYYLFKLLEAKDKAWKCALFAGMFIGLSFMSKGPVSLYALLLPFLVAYGIVFGFRKNKAYTPAVLLMLLVAVVLTIWWPTYIFLFDEQTAENIAETETAAWLSNNVRPWYYYFDFFTETGIWTIPAFLSLLYPYIIKRVENPKLYKFTFWWTIVGLILLSLIPEKKKRYLFPIIIPLAVNTSFYFSVLHRYYSTFSTKEIFPVKFHYSLLAGICFLFPLSGFFIFKGQSNGVFWFVLATLALWAIGLWMIKKLMQKQYPQLFYGNVAIVVSVVLFVLPLSKIFYDHPNRVLPKVIHTYEEKYQTKTYSFGEISPEIIWEFDEKLPQFDLMRTPPDFENATFLVNEKVEEDFLHTFDKSYRVTFLKEIDVNYAAPERKNHKSRLTAKLFLLEKL